MQNTCERFVQLVLRFIDRPPRTHPLKKAERALILLEDPNQSFYPLALEDRALLEEGLEWVLAGGTSGVVEFAGRLARERAGHCKADSALSLKAQEAREQQQFQFNAQLPGLDERARTCLRQMACGAAGLEDEYLILLLTRPSFLSELVMAPSGVPEVDRAFKRRMDIIRALPRHADRAPKTDTAEASSQSLLDWKRRRQDLPHDDPGNFHGPCG